MADTQAVIEDKALEDDDILLTDAEREAARDDEAEAEAQAEPAAAAEEPKPAAAEPAAAEDEPGVVVAPADSIPLLRAEPTEPATTRLAAIETEVEALSTKFDDGDLTAKEYAAALKKLTDEKANLDWTVRKAALAAEIEEQAATRAWFGTVNEFLAAHPEIKANNLRYASFDMAVREVTGDTGNNSLTATQKLQKAYDRWAGDLGIAKPAAAAPKQAEATPSPAPRRTLPPNLTKIPAAAVQSTDDGRFGVLDRLLEADPIAFEARMASLSDADRAAYMASR